MSVAYPHVRVDGGARRRGLQYGEQARARVKLSLEKYAAVFIHYAGWDWPRVIAEASRFGPPIAAYDPTCCEEMRGIADGAGVAYEAVLALNARTEIMFAARARQRASGTTPRECSSFAVLPSASAGRRTLIGQNWDWLTHCFDTVVVLEATPDFDPAYVTVVEAGLLAKSGFNSAGLGLATNALVTDQDDGEPAVPYHVVLRSILRAETLSDAAVAIERAPRSSSANYLIASDEGAAIDIEAIAGKPGEVHRLSPEEGILVHTNHVLSPFLRAKDIFATAMPNTDSRFRRDRLRELISAGQGAVAPEMLERVLADHSNWPSGVCCHPDETTGFHDRATTVASLIMDLHARQMWLADGRPCTTPYRRLDYASILGTGSGVCPFR